MIKIINGTKHYEVIVMNNVIMKPSFPISITYNNKNTDKKISNDNF